MSDSITTVENLLARHSFFQDLAAEHLKLLAGAAMEKQFEAGELIFREGDPANRFYLLMEGKVALESQQGEAEPVTIQTLGPGEVLGWSWLFPPYYWHFDARALEPTRAVFLYGTRLREQCERNHDLGYELMKRFAQVLIQRLQATRRRLLNGRAT